MQLSPELLRIVGVVLSLAGTLILAIRVTNILSALTLAVKTHDLNFSIQAARSEGRQDIPKIVMHGNHPRITEAEQLGTKLLILGFMLQIVGGILTGASYLL